MRVILVILFFSTFIVGGWWLKKEGPERWPNSHVTTVEVPTVNVNTTIPAPTTTNTAVSLITIAPSNVRVTTTSTDVTVAWDPIVGVHGYALSRNDVFIGVVFGTQFVDFALPKDTTLTYTVAGVDAMNIISTAVATVSTTTSSQLATTASPTNTPTTTNTKTSQPSTTTNKNTNTSTPTKTTNTPATTNTSKPTNTSTPPATPPTGTTNTNTATPATNTNTATPATNTNTTPPPSAPACGQGGSCTASDIAAHSTRSNCWVYLTTVNKVYNVTAYVSNGSTHPGGDVIVPFCGKNITAPFTSSASGGKKHSTSALNSVLQAYYIGPYAP